MSLRMNRDETLRTPPPSSESICNGCNSVSIDHTFSKTSITSCRIYLRYLESVSCDPKAVGPLIKKQCTAAMCKDYLSLCGQEYVNTRRIWVCHSRSHDRRVKPGPMPHKMLAQIGPTQIAPTCANNLCG